MSTLRSEVIQQLLFSKWLLSQILSPPEAKISSFSLARKILIAHDAVEFGLAAIADQIGALPKQNKLYLMNYFDSIKDKIHPGEEVEGKEYFRKLNTVRGNLKHVMILPEPNQWVNVDDKVYNHLTGWCRMYLQLELDALDNSILLRSPGVKELYDNAKKELSFGRYQQALELLAKALYLLFEENSALRSLQVGIARAEDAIKVAAFGVHANDFLSLQEFLPKVTKTSDGKFTIRWEQEEFGHPGNWREDSASFCVDAFLDLALKIQDAEWIPGAISFLNLYEYKVEAIKDDVEIRDKSNEVIFASSSPKSEVIKSLKKGEFIRAGVSRTSKKHLGGLFQAHNIEEEEEIFIMSHVDQIFGYVTLRDVKITCIPRENHFVKENFPDLPIIDMQLD
ncbi:MAG: hypothetical protein Q8N14_00535 [Candidatus Omnitrophota bacterium]|nr:hypothetical protein [Candidatus Omnitrophota bacterium]